MLETSENNSSGLLLVGKMLKSTAATFHACDMFWMSCLVSGTYMVVAKIWVSCSGVVGDGIICFRDVCILLCCTEC